MFVFKKQFLGYNSKIYINSVNSGNILFAVYQVAIAKGKKGNMLKIDQVVAFITIHYGKEKRKTKL